MWNPAMLRMHYGLSLGFRQVRVMREPQKLTHVEIARVPTGLGEKIRRERC
jgi:hypothetical protein